MNEIQKRILNNYKTYDEAIADCKFTSQTEALLHLLNGDNVFISGPPGSGKSHVIQEFCKIKKAIDEDIIIYKTSTTGISAINIEGMTIHSYIGMGISNMKFEQAKSSPDIKKKWYFSDKKIKATDILIIDEVSMLSERALEYVVERIKYVKKSLGKIQIIVSGDFSQLPPVNSSKHENDQDCSNFCYKTKSWNECDFKTLYLDKIYRTEDKRLSHMLTNISIGKGNTESVKDTLLSLKTTKNKYNKGSVLLLSTNANVDKINKEKQAENSNELITFETIYNDKTIVNADKKDLEFARIKNIPESVSLKEGDTVMVTQNNPDCEATKFSAPPLMNGTIGTFIHNNISDIWGIETKDCKYWFYNGPTEILHTDIEWQGDKQVEIVKSKITQYPLKLAYAITIHKSQGQTFSNITTDLNSCWTEGLGYVSLSRAISLDGITLIENDWGEVFKKKSLEINRHSLEIKKDLIKTAKDNKEKYKDDLRDFFNKLSEVDSNSDIVDNSFKNEKDNSSIITIKDMSPASIERWLKFYGILSMAMATDIKNALVCLEQMKKELERELE